MRRTLIALHFLFSSCLLSSCVPDILQAPITASPQGAEIFVYRFDIPALVGLSEDFQITKEIPFSYPVSCGLYEIFTAPIGQYLAVELSCPNGQSVLFMDIETGTITLPFTDTDSHFLAWQSDGRAAYFKVDSLSDPKVIRTYVSGEKDVIPIPEFTYDLAPKPNSNDFTFTLSRGLGFGSEMYLAKQDGSDADILYVDQFNYISHARFSPDGGQIAFVKIPDTQTPFTVGELWVIPILPDPANGLQVGRFIAYADAGHGYAANWSPDGTKIAFVVRENPEDEIADRSGDALISNIYIIDVGSEESTKVTRFTEGRVETPHWSPDGNTLAFNLVLNGRMKVHIADIESGEVRPLVTDIAPAGGSTCCPAWMRK